MVSLLTYEDLADVFSRAYTDTGSIADALRVVDSTRISAIKAACDSFRIVEACADARGVSARRVFDDDRHPAVCEARWLASKILSVRGWPSTEIGRALKRHHATILHGLKRIESSPALMALAANVLQSLTKTT